MKIKDIYTEYAENLQPNEDFKNNLKIKLDEAEKNQMENKDENLYEMNFKVTETKKLKLSFIIPLIAAIIILCTLTLVAAVFFRDKSDDKKYLRTTLAEETTLSDYNTVSEIYTTDVSNTEMNIPYGENIRIQTKTEIYVNDMPEMSYIETDVTYDENIQTQKKTDIYAVDIPQTSYIETDVTYDENIQTQKKTDIYDTDITETSYIETDVTYDENNISSAEITSDVDDSDYTQLNFDKIYASAGGNAVAEIYIDKSYSLYIMLLKMNFDKYYISLESVPEFYDDNGKELSSSDSNPQFNYFLIEMPNPRSSGIKIRAVFSIDSDTPPGNYEVSFDIHNATGISAYDEKFINVKGIIEVN